MFFISLVSCSLKRIKILQKLRDKKDLLRKEVLKSDELRKKR